MVSITTEGVDFLSAYNIDDLPKVNFIFIVLVQLQLSGSYLVQRCVVGTVKNMSASFALRGPWWLSSKAKTHIENVHPSQYVLLCDFSVCLLIFY